MIGDFVIPLCATIHLAGSMIKINAFALALCHMMGIQVNPASMISFIVMLGVTMVAAPAYGGAVVAVSRRTAGDAWFSDPMC